MDLTCPPNQILKKSISIIKSTSDNICAVKINHHLLLPLSLTEIKKLISVIHSRNLLVIADLKLNDISATNLVVIKHLWKMGFDAVIVNPFVGYSEGLEPLLTKSKSKNKGVLFLVYMSHKGAKDGYGLDILKQGQKKKLYLEFVERAKRWRADGIIVGATRPNLIKEISNLTKCKCHHKSLIDIYTPGIGTQGGDASKSIKSGANYLIVGRSIVNSKNPYAISLKLKSNSWISH